MKQYHKIQTVFLRDPETKFKTLLDGQFSIPEFEYLKNNKWIWTEKVDGTNIRIQYDGNVYFRGKTENALLPQFLVEKLIALFPKNKLENVFPEVKNSEMSVCLYGEGYGAKIQKGGGNYRLDQSFVLFDIRVGEWWLQRKDVEDIAQKLNIDIVPIVGGGSLFDMVEFVRRGFYSNWGHFIAEGVVARPEIELFTRNRQRIITKLKHKDFNEERR